MYFTNETEEKILEYQKTRDERIFEKYIYMPFEKIASSLLHKLKTYDIDGDLNVIIQETIIKMWKEIDKFDPATGFKAYSFFSVVARRFLINENMKSQTQLKRTKVINDYDFGGNESDIDIMKSYTSCSQEQDVHRSDYVNKFYKDKFNNIKNFLNEKIESFTANERNIVLIIIEVMNNCEFFVQDDFTQKNIKKIISMLSGESERSVKLVINKIKDLIEFYKDEINDTIYFDIFNIYK